MKLLLLLIPFACFGQKPINPDADDYYCTNNYEWFYDSSYSKKDIKIDLDAVDFMEWVFENWEPSGGVYIVSGSHKYTEKTWKRKGRKPGNWDWYTPKTAKELWLEWYKLINECWWE